MNRVKEIHLLLGAAEISPIGKYLTTYLETLNALKVKDIVCTTQPHFLSFKYAESLFVSLDGYTEHEITLGACEGTTRMIKEENNIENLLLSGEFSWYQ